jgi:hypothetical protein
MFNAKYAGKEAGCTVSVLNVDGLCYRQVRVHNCLYEAHRLIFCMMTGDWPQKLIDHKDRDGLNNRWANLREADRAQNQHNRGKRKDNPSGYKGVRAPKKGKWHARITVNRKSIHLGAFLSPEEAARAYDRAALRHFGEYAGLNFPTAVAA